MTQNKYIEFLKTKWISSYTDGTTVLLLYTVIMENTSTFSWKRAEKKYIEFLKTTWISSRTEPRFYFHGKRHKKVYRIPEEHID